MPSMICVSLTYSEMFIASSTCTRSGSVFLSRTSETKVFKEAPVSAKPSISDSLMFLKLSGRASLMKVS
ncbi:MAG: hypothetical protein IJE75_05480, partial [Firmicutes bacterium]|nr:hypothetical protein [Bacillota bacterium]